MSNVRALPWATVPTSEPDANLVGLLEDLLQRAKRGELRNFAGTGFQADGVRLRAFAGEMPDTYRMLGSIHWLAEEYIRRVKGEDD